MSNIYNELQKRILILDGAMGTMLQDYNFSEEDYRGTRFKDYPTSLKGNNDFVEFDSTRCYCRHSSEIL